LQNFTIALRDQGKRKLGEKGWAGQETRWDEEKNCYQERIYCEMIKNITLLNVW